MRDNCTATFPPVPNGSKKAFRVLFQSLALFWFLFSVVMRNLILFLISLLLLCTLGQGNVFSDMQGAFNQAAQAVSQGGESLGNQMSDITTDEPTVSFEVIFDEDVVPTPENMLLLTQTMAQSAWSLSVPWASKVGVLVMTSISNRVHVLGKVFAADDRVIDVALSAGEEWGAGANRPYRLHKPDGDHYRYLDCQALSVIGQQQGTPKVALFSIISEPADYNQKYVCPNDYIRTATYSPDDTLLFHKYQHKASCGTSTYNNVYLIWPGHSPAAKIGKRGTSTNNCVRLTAIIAEELDDNWGYSGTVPASSFYLQFTD